MYMKNDFDGKTAHQISQYIKGHLFSFMDSLMGMTHTSVDLDAQKKDNPGKHPFEYDEVHRLFRTYLRFTTAYFRKLKTLGKSVSTSAVILCRIFTLNFIWL